jgi:hypothetical protein
MRIRLMYPSLVLFRRALALPQHGRERFAPHRSRNHPDVPLERWRRMMNVYEQPDTVDARTFGSEPMYGTRQIGTKDRERAMLLFSAGLAGTLALTYGVRQIRTRTRKPITQSMTVVLPRERVDVFFASEQNVLLAAGSKKDLRLLERLELRDAPEGRGTEMYASSRFASNKYEIKNALRRAKALLETGEIPTGARYS